MNALLLVVGIGLFVAVGCESSPVEIDELAPDPNLPPARVELPSPPPASAFVVQETNDDGTLRVEGIIRNQEKYLGQEVEVRGIITDLSNDCTPRRNKKDQEECLAPHFFIKDSRDGNRQLLVVGHPGDFRGRTALKVGQEHVIKGTYSKSARGFVASEDGLLLPSEALTKK